MGRDDRAIMLRSALFVTAGRVLRGPQLHRFADREEGGWHVRTLALRPSGRFRPTARNTHKLREDVVFHDGEKFDAAAVKANYDFVKKPENAVTAVSLLQAYDRAEVVSPYVVKLVLSMPDFSFLESDLECEARPDFAEIAGEGDLCGGGRGLAGTGPFVFESYTRGQSAVFARNAAYNWGAAIRNGRVQ